MSMSTHQVLILSVFSPDSHMVYWAKDLQHATSFKVNSSPYIYVSISDGAFEMVSVQICISDARSRHILVQSGRLPKSAVQGACIGDVHIYAANTTRIVL